jgi:hypothetical protein
MARMKIRPGGKVNTARVERHPVEVAQETVLLTDFQRPNAETGLMELVPAYSFATAEGRGTSPEIIPFDELPQYVETLRAAQENGVPRRDSADTVQPYIPTYEILEGELRQGEYRTKRKDGKNDVTGPDGKPLYDSHGDRVFMRSRTNRGAKNQKILPEHFDSLVDWIDGLQDETDAMLELWNEALPELLAEREAEATAAALEKAEAAGTDDEDDDD